MEYWDMMAQGRVGVIVLLALYPWYVAGGHYNGGSISLSARPGTGTGNVEIIIDSTHTVRSSSSTRSYGHYYRSMSTPLSGSVTIVLTGTPLGGGIQQYQGQGTIQVTENDGIIRVGYTGCCWISPFGGTWDIFAILDVSARRTDTGNYNSNPVLDVPFRLTLIPGCSFFKLNVTDPDGDLVKCRAAEGDECGSHCNFGIPGNITESCELRIDIENAGNGPYLVNLVVEDFATADGPPLSKIYAQFLLFFSVSDVVGPQFELISPRPNNTYVDPNSNTFTIFYDEDIFQPSGTSALIRFVNKDDPSVIYHTIDTRTVAGQRQVTFKQRSIEIRPEIDFLSPTTKSISILIEERFAATRTDCTSTSVAITDTNFWFFYISFCGHPETDAHASLEIFDVGTKGQLVDGEEVQFTCEAGYEVADDIGTWNETCMLGIWNRPSLYGCKDINECSEMTNVCGFGICWNIPGSFLCLCPPGYFWNSTQQNCSEISCGDPGELENAVRVGSDFNFCDNVTYTCDTGFSRTSGILGDIVITCQDNGKWTARDSCSEIDCGEPPCIPFATRYGSGTKYGNLIIFTCMDGFIRMDGVSKDINITCGEDGKWQGCSTCKDIDECTTMADICGEGTCVNNIGSYTCLCNEGYLFDTSSQKCVVTKCSDPGEIEHATRKGSDFEYCDTVNYTCNTGYARSSRQQGDIQIRCTSEGKWIGAETCLEINCGEPPCIPFATRNGLGTKFGDTITFTCMDGFIRIDEESQVINIRCGEDGRWQGCSSCTDVNECTSSPCGSVLVTNRRDSSAENRCINTVGGYFCDCYPGLRLTDNGHSCEGIPVDVEAGYVPTCDFYNLLKVCKNGGQCIMTDGGASCSCPEGFEGEQCEVNVAKQTQLTNMAIAGLVIGGLAVLGALAFSFLRSIRSPVPQMPSGPRLDIPVRPPQQRPFFPAMRYRPRPGARVPALGY